MTSLNIRPVDVFVTICMSLSLVVLFAVCYHHYRQNENERSDRIRHNAAAVSAKIQRWADLEDRFFEDLEPIIVDVSEKIAQSHSTEPANRILFKGFADAKGKSSQRWLDEQLELRVAELAVDIPDAAPKVRRTLGALKYAEEEQIRDLSITMQTVLRDDAVLMLNDSPDIGNVLRSKAAEKRMAFLRRVRDISEPLLQDMQLILDLPQADLLDAASVGQTRHPRSEPKN